MGNVMSGSGQLFNETPMSAMYAGANLVRDYAIPGFQKGREIAKGIVKEGKIKQLYANAQQTGQMPVEEDLLNIYSQVGDEDGVMRIQERINEREGRYQQAQDQIFLKQIENAQANGQFDLIPKILDQRNADSRLVARTGKYQFDPNLGTFDRPLQAGETAVLPDGSKITGDNIGGINIKFGKNDKGQWSAVGIDTKQRDEMIKAQLAQQKAATQQGGRILPAGAADKLANTEFSVSELDKMKNDILNKEKYGDDLFGVLNTQGGVGLSLRAKAGNVAAQNLLSNLESTKQIVGKGLEEGVLRKEDTEKYNRILGQPGLTREQMASIYDEINNKIKNKYNTDLASYGKAGYNVSGYTPIDGQQIARQQSGAQQQPSRIKSIKVIERTVNNQ